MSAGTVAGTDGPAIDGPIVQSVRIGFRALQLVILLLAAVWLTSNMRQVPPEMQAVVLRFGQVTRVQQSGLVLAWPRPIERVELLPGPNRQLDLKIEARTARAAGLDDGLTPAGAVPDDAGAFLSGDGGVVLLATTLTWRITDARAYFLSAEHVAPALRRLFLASAIALAAGRVLDDFLAVRPEHAGDADAKVRRQALRGELAAAVNRRLQALEQAGAGLGVAVTRADVAALLPPSAKMAFDAVLNAGQMADQGLAEARTEAARSRQAGDRERDRLLTEARATAEERLGDAHAKTAAITALEQRMNPATRPGLLDQVYRERVATVLRQAGAVQAVDARGDVRVLLPGTAP